MTIYPTHACFDDAADYVNAVAAEGQRAELERLRIVHGIIRFPEGQAGAGTRTAHAWIEDGDQVIDAGLLNGQRVNVRYTHDEFYTRLRVEHVTRYTALELLLYVEAHGSTGPWRADLRQLLRTPVPPVEARRASAENR